MTITGIMVGMVFLALILAGAIWNECRTLRKIGKRMERI